MQITIDHETVYRYETPVTYSIQSLRLTPQTFDGQNLRQWSVEAPGAGMLQGFTDSFGNVTHTLVIDRPHQEVRIRVRGRVSTTDTNGVVTGTNEPFPPLFFLRATELTKADGAIRALARAAHSASKNDLDCLHQLMEMLHESLEYQVGETDALTTAAEALGKGVGVCQDHAHVFIAGARSLDIPARYVSGYLLQTETGAESQAAHAWAEALVPDLGWVAFDVTNLICASDRYVRVGVGLDYREASPVRGVRQGGGAEDMAVSVRVSQSDGASQ
ncbi:transglutaminase family protein [Magnetospira thiophila]